MRSVPGGGNESDGIGTGKFSLHLWRETITIEAGRFHFRFFPALLRFLSNVADEKRILPAMKKLLIWIVILGLLGGGAAAAYQPTVTFLKNRNKPEWRTEEVLEGDIILVVNATGKVEPVQRVTVGAVVSGPISDLLVDFNSRVKKDELMAVIDPRLYDATVSRDRAVLKTREAEILRAKAFLEQAQNDEKRAKDLSKTNPDFISQTEMDQFKFDRMAREADLVVAETNRLQAQAQLENSEANLEYTEVRSPVDGIVIDRKIDSGQTLAAQFQTPEMFVVAPNMDERMFIYASVDEADIGLIRLAQSEEQPVSFTIDAYPDELFKDGKIYQVRLASNEEQNVITYPVVVETPNPELKLLPGMTANLSFQIRKHEATIKIPNASLRFYPPRERVHPDDLGILDGTDELLQQAEDQVGEQSATERAETKAMRNTRHVWIQDGDLLRARKVILGDYDSRYTQMLDGDLKPGDLLVIGEKIKK